MERFNMAETEQIIIEEEAVKRNFVQIPYCILRNPTIPEQLKILYADLLSYAWDKKSCYPGQDTLAEDLGCHVDTIGRNLKKLRKLGLFTWKRTGFSQHNTYYFSKIPQEIKDSYENAVPKLKKEKIVRQIARQKPQDSATKYAQPAAKNGTIKASNKENKEITQLIDSVLRILNLASDDTSTKWSRRYAQMFLQFDWSEFLSKANITNIRNENGELKTPSELTEILAVLYKQLEKQKYNTIHVTGLRTLWYKKANILQKMTEERAKNPGFVTEEQMRERMGMM
jgi:hypothetical protein